jgi:hypothetical protein
MADTLTDVADSLTIDLSKVPGQTFHRKALKYVAHTHTTQDKQRN